MFLGGILLLMGNVFGQSKIALGHIPYAEPAPKIDGFGDEWPKDSLIAFIQNNPISKNANGVKVQMAWDEQYLYLYAEIADLHVIRLSANTDRLYLNDAMELYIDPLDDSGNRMDINDYQFIVDHTGDAAVLKGDKSQIMDTSKHAPKEIGISTVAFQKATQLLEANDEHGAGWSVELALPFAGLGAMPQAGMRMKIDFCVDDADSLMDLEKLPEGSHLHGYFASNWDGYSDFSFPDHWREFALVGGPSVQSQISRGLLPYWIYIVLGLVLVAAIVIGWQAYRIAQLRDVLPRTEVRPALMRKLAEMEMGLVNADSAANQVAQEPDKQLDSPNEPPSKAIPPSKPNLSEPEVALHPQIERCRQFILSHLDE